MAPPNPVALNSPPRPRTPSQSLQAPKPSQPLQPPGPQSLQPPRCPHSCPGALTVAAAAPQVPLTLQSRGRPAAQAVAAVAVYNRCSAQALMSGEDSSEDTGEDRGGETTSARPPALVV